MIRRAMAGFQRAITGTGGELLEEAPAGRVPGWIKRAGVLGVVILAVFAAAVFSRFILAPAPAQPIPFSHRVHATMKKLDCFFCHPYATVSSNAGMPPVEKCYLCHQVIASRLPPIAKMLTYYENGKPVPWVRVYKVADYVHFSHQAHLAKRIDCGQCHGNVAKMDRVGAAQRTDMNFCITCHWRRNAPDSCSTCHY